MRNLLRSAEYAKGSEFRNNDYSSKFDATSLAMHINLVELSIKNIVGIAMFEDMILVRNTQNYDYDEDPPVKLFPANPTYEKIFVEFIFYALGYEMLATMLTFRNVEVSNTGVDFYEISGIKAAPRDERLSAVKSSKDAASKYRDLLKEYLCKNVDDHPLLDKSICESGCGCNGSDTLVPKKESSFYFAPPSY